MFHNFSEKLLESNIVNELPKDLKLHLFGFFNLAHLKQTTLVSKEWNELTYEFIKPHLIVRLNETSHKEKKAFFDKIINEALINKKLVRAILSTTSILDAFIHLPNPNSTSPNTQGTCCLTTLISKNPDIAAESLDLLFYRLDTPFKSGLPAVKFWADKELFTKSIQLALKLLDKQEIIDYFKKSRGLLANHFRNTVDTTPLIAAKIINNPDLRDLVKDYLFLYENKWGSTKDSQVSTLFMSL